MSILWENIVLVLIVIALMMVLIFIAVQRGISFVQDVVSFLSCHTNVLDVKMVDQLLEKFALVVELSFHDI